MEEETKGFSCPMNYANIYLILYTFILKVIFQPMQVGL